MKPFGKGDAGVHQARLVKVIDVGTQVDTWDGQEKENRKISIAFQIPFQKDGIDYAEYAGLPYKGLITPYKSEKAKIRGLLDALGFNDETDNDVIEFLISKIGTVVQATVIENEWNDKISPKIQEKGFLACPKGMPEVDWGNYTDKGSKLGLDKVSVIETFRKAGNEEFATKTIPFEDIANNEQAWDYKYLKDSKEWKAWQGQDSTPTETAAPTTAEYEDDLPF